LFSLELHVTEKAVEWYKEELLVDEGMTIRFFVRYGGVGGLVPGFSIGVKVEEENQPHVSVVVDGITFFVSEEDAWYFDGKDLHVTYDEQLEEPQFTYL